MSSLARFDPSHCIDHVVTDPAYLDPKFPFEQFVTHFISQGSVVHATVWIAQGSAAKGTVILSPQMYGGDRLESLIIPLMTSGINVLTFHPRGMWDNQHVYTLSSAVDDVLAAASFIRSTSSGDPKTPHGCPWRTDLKRVAVLGLSGGGGNAGLAACVEDPQIASVVAIAPNSMMGFDTAEAMRSSVAMFDQMKAITAGRIDLAAMLTKMTAADHDRVNPFRRMSRLVDKNVLLIGAQQDAVAPLETNHRPIAKALRDAGVRGFHEVIFETDHGFLTKRIALARLVIAWLRQQCGF
jgi:pimeloyl-ACP methyl ester carboxylesterase